MSTPADWPPVPALIGALLRVPAHAIHRRLIRDLNAAGFDELRVPHIAVLQYPGPDGVSPTVLADRAGISKQAMNQLLRSLESAGYVERSASAGDGRLRVVRLTRRGRAAYSRVADILREVEKEWAAELGPESFAELKALLGRVWESPLAWPEVGGRLKVQSAVGRPPRRTGARRRDPKAPSLRR
jgi:DNA-binding MarR family transcriptional regulator